jgi:hypothetical protein
MILDCLSPALPRGLIRVSILSLSGVLRALCGVSAGAAKASLSVHFARSGNVGELNAKDASQETVISLLGMLVGGLVVSWVVDPVTTWTLLITLLAIHLGMNTAAVRAVKMNTLNRQRACLFFSNLLEGKPLNIEEVGKQERIFERDGVIRWRGGPILGWARIGVSLEEIASSLGNRKLVTGSVDHGKISLQGLVSLFESEKHLLWCDKSRQTVLIALQEGTSPEQQLKAWVHAMLVVREFSIGRLGQRNELTDVEVFGLVELMLITVNKRWAEDSRLLRNGGWDVDVASLETTSGTRFCLTQDRD